MTTTTIRNALGALQDDPDQESAWSDLRSAVSDPAAAQAETATLLEAARRAHEIRREYDAVAKLLELEVGLARKAEDAAREAELVTEQARVLDEEVLDDEGATLSYMRLLELRPGDVAASDALEKAEAKRARWFEIVKRFIEEAKGTKEPAFKSSLFVSAAEAAYRYGLPQLSAEGKKGKKKVESLFGEIVTGLKKALDIDPKNRRAALLLERVYRQRGEIDAVVEVLGRFAAESTLKEEKAAAYVRLARLHRTRTGDKDRAMKAYEAVLDLVPGHPEATNQLVDHFTAREEWDHLVALYEEQLQVGGLAQGQEVGVLLQIAMVHWKMREKPDAAEPYFERLRKLEPAHPGMLGFFREACGAKGDFARLSQILTEAQRVLPDGPPRATIVAELAQLAEEGANATRAIEQWRALLRQDPSSKEARASLRRLYRQTGGWNALADLLRGDLEKVGAGDREGRLPILREIAGLYRENLKNDSALVTVLSQIATLDPEDKEAARELSRAYASLGRWREMLATQTRVAELESDPGARAEIYREVARRWLEQFSNMQNAVDAYEKLLEAAPGDAEATAKLRELYTKRRAYRPLHDLLARHVEQMPAGEERRATWLEMAKLAAERLDRSADAVASYKRILAEEPGSTHALDALEKLGEREKDYAVVSEVLERRVELAKDAPGGAQIQLAILQKLGAIYADRLKDDVAAMRTWRRVLELSPGHAKALRVLRDTFLAKEDYEGLSELYGQTEDWEGLAEVLSSAADRASDENAKIELSFRAADVYAERLKTPERAFRAYERVLAVRPDDRRAAAALVPLYEHEEKWARLPALYEVLLGHAEAQEDKLELLSKLAHVVGQHLQDRPASFAYARRAFELDPERPEALEAFEKIARTSNEWSSFVDTLNARLAAAGEAMPKALARQHQAKIADVYAHQLGRMDDAIAAYRALIEADPNDDDAMGALDRLLRTESRQDDLRWLFGLRVERANTAQKIHLYVEWASLEEDVFGAPEQAVAIHRKLLEIVPQHGGALRALARLLRVSGDAEGAAEVLEKERDQREGVERAQREVELARLYLGSLKRPNDALAAARRALELVPHPRFEAAPPSSRAEGTRQGGAPSGHAGVTAEYRGAIEVIEELLEVSETRGRAAVVLEAHYAETGNAARQAEVLEVMIATAAAKQDRITLYSRLADVHEQRIGAVAVAFDVIARAASEFPTELDLWDRLAVLSNRTQRAGQFVAAIVAAVPPEGETGLPQPVEMDLAERAATLYDEMLGDIESARPYLERILTRDPGNERAFGRLKQILTTLERWSELESLYERAIAAAPDLSRRADLLAEVALIAEEITGDCPKAIVYYERILELEPNHEQTVRALDSLYSSEERWESLANLLRGRLVNATLDEAVLLKLRLGALYFGKLSDPSSAIVYLDEVLAADATNREARDLTEKCLAVPELRPRAATILEQVYIAQDAARDLVRILEVRLETTEALEERRELLRRIAELRDERLGEGAFDVYARLVPIAPDDVQARVGLITMAKKLGALEEAAQVLEASAKVADVPQPRAEILSELAQLLEKSLGDAERAEVVYRQVLEIDPDDAALALPIARALERIYSASGRTKELVDILRTCVRLEDDPSARREIQGRLGELCESALDDPAGAIAAWQARLEDDPLDGVALAALDRLYERTQEWRKLVEILRARERTSAPAGGEDAGAAGEAKALRHGFMVRIAVTLADRIADVPEAILAYRELLDEYGPERSALSALERLYESAEQWPDLADTLEDRLSIAEENDERIALLAKLGAVRGERLAEIPGAIEAFRQALLLDASHGPSRAALEALLDEPDVRREVAGILRPLYEADGQDEKLLRVIDIEAEYAEDPGARLQLFREAANVSEKSLSDTGRAFGYALRALEELPEQAEFTPWLETAERLAGITSKFEDLVALLKKIVVDIVDGDLELAVTLKIAELSRDRLGDKAAARASFVRALELRADDPVALSALEVLYEEEPDPAALLDVLRRRAEIAEDDAARRALLFKQARLSDETLRDPAGAIDVYRQIHDTFEDPAAFDALERLYGSTERWDDLIELYEGRIGKGPPGDVKAELHHKLGEVYEVRLGEHDRAFDQYEEALRFSAQHEPTVAALERLMAERGQAARAAEMLEHVYLVRADWRRVMATLEARLEVSQDPDEKRGLLKRLAQLHEEQAENYAAALETTAKLLAEDVTDEPTWAELERLARVANAEARLAEIFAGELAKVTADEPATAKLARRTGGIYEQQRELERALAFYRRAYAFAPEEDEESFAAIDRILRETGRHEERVELYRGALEYRDEPNAHLATLHAIAKLEEEELGSEDRAIDTFRSALDVDDADVFTLESLARLLARRERWADLAELTRKRAEQSALPDDEAKFRLALGRLLQDKLNDLPQAVDEYESVVELAPEGASTREAVAALESLLKNDELKSRVVDILRPIYERADDWRHLIAVNEERLGIAADDAERVLILRESAKLWEERGEDVAKAFASVRDAFVLDPDDGESRAELDRLAEVTLAWDALASAYERSIERIEGVGQKELLSALARVHDEKRDDPRSALDAWDRLFQVDESDSEPLERMDELATLLSDWDVLVRVLAKRAELTSDDEERASIWRRIGEARRDMLDDATGATEAYERALELEPDSAFTMDHLIALYEAKNDAARLVDLYRRRVELCGEDDEGLKFQLHLDAANRYEFGLGDRREAIDQLSQALAVRAGDADVVGRLGELYAAEKMWPELLDNLRQQVDASEEEAARRALRKRIGALFAEELEDAPQALAAYREVLAGGVFDEEATKAIRTLGETRDELRAEAADALEPVLRAAGKDEELASVLEMRLRAETDPIDRARTLRAVAEVAEQKLDDLARAEAALLRALSETPESAELHAELERICALETSQGGKPEPWQRYADTLSDRAGATFDAAVATDLNVRLGRIAEEKLGDDARAARALVAATEQSGDTEAVLASLDRLFGRLGDARALADVLERRIALEADANLQAGFYHRLASLQIEEFGEPGNGLATLRQAVERVPEHEASRASMERLLERDALFEEAFEALEGVYRALERKDDLARLYERKVTRADGVRERARARLDLARILEEDAKEPARAQRVLEESLLEDPSDGEVLGELERLAAETGGWSSLCDALAKAITAAQELPVATRAELWTKLANFRRDELKDAAAAEEAFGAALALDPENVEILKALENLRRVPGRERDLVETLRTRAKLEHDVVSKGELLREAKQVAEKELADAALAEACLRDWLVDDEGNLWALEELTRLREQADDHREVIALLLKRAECEADGPAIAALKHRAAQVTVDKVGELADAIQLYEELFENDPTDAEAAARLRDLYPRAGRPRDLAGLLGQLVDAAESPADRATLRIELARLQIELEQTRDAADTLRAVLDEEPEHGEAVLALSELFERTGQDEELAELLDTQIERAQGRGDEAQELTLKVRLGEVFETRLRDTPRALATFEAVLERSPDHRSALEAVARLAEGRDDWGRAAAVLAKLAESIDGEDGISFALRLAAAYARVNDDEGIERALQRALAIDSNHGEARDQLRSLYERTRNWGRLAEILVGDAAIVARDNPEALAIEPADAEGRNTTPPQRPSNPDGRPSLRPSLRPSMPPTPSIPPPLTGPRGDYVRLMRRAAEIHVQERKAAEDAVPLLEQVVAVAPHDRELLLLLCDAYTGAGRQRDATQVLERVIASYGTRRSKELSVYHHRLAQTFVSLGDKDVAMAQLDMAFKIDPGSVTVLRDLGVLAFETNDLDRAQKTFRALLLQRLDGGAGISKGEVFYYLGEISAKQGDTARAVQMLERAIENEPSLDRAKVKLQELKG